MKLLRKRTQDIIKKAFDLWDIKDWNPNEIDPLVNLLFAACASESINLEKKIKENVIKTKESLMHSLLPKGILTAQPACSIACSKPIEPKLQLDSNFNFSYQTQITEKKEKKFIELTYKPVLPVFLFGIEPKWIFEGDILKSYSDQISFKSTKRGSTGKSIWLGIQPESSLVSWSDLNELTFFLQLKESINVGEHLINDFEFAESMAVFCEGKPVNLRAGFSEDDFYIDYERQGKHFSSESFAQNQLIFETLSFFNDGFFKLSTFDSDEKLKRKRMPDFFTDIFDESVLENLSEDLVWLEFRFDTLSNEELEKVAITLNAFPITNYKNTDISLSDDEPIIEIPLQESEHLLGVSDYNLFDDYHNNVTEEYKDSVPYVIRKLDMEKFSGFDLDEMLERIIDRFSTDYMAFQEEYKISSDDIQRLREALKPIQSEKQKQSGSIDKNKTFAILNPDNDKNIATVELKCKITSGSLGNSLHEDQILIPGNSLLDPDSTLTVTRSVGGRDGLTTQEQTRAFSNYILSSNQIITTEDIRRFCKLELGDMAQDISVEHGAFRGETGLRKCILVKIQLNSNAIDNINLQMLRSSLENKIRRKSNLIMPVKAQLVIK